MSRQREREEVIAILHREGVPLEVARRLLRYGATLHRLAEAQCNGDWPCDNGERLTTVCAECELGYAPAALSKAGICPECRTQHKVEALAAQYGLTPIFQGDPRGAVLKVKVPSGYTNDWGKEGVCIA